MTLLERLVGAGWTVDEVEPQPFEDLPESLLWTTIRGVGAMTARVVATNGGRFTIDLGEEAADVRVLQIEQRKRRPSQIASKC